MQCDPSASQDPALREDYNMKLSSAVFLGDLFAIGLLPRITFEELVSLLVRNLRSPDHYDALHMVFLHSTAHIKSNLSRGCLHDCRRVLTESQPFFSTSVDDDSVNKSREVSSSHFLNGRTII